jgi:hypothetical protein
MVYLNKSVYRSRYSEKATDWTAQEPWFDSVQEQERFLFSMLSKAALGRLV